MKSFLLSFIVLCTFISVTMAQTASFKYQGVARNAQNAALPNQNISLRLSILNQGGTPVFVETHQTQTSDLGIFSVNVCAGTNPTGSCATIDWSSGNFQLKVELDPAGGANFINMGNSPILQVPVAAFAVKAGTAVNDADGNSTNEIQNLNFNAANNTLAISQANNVDLSSLKNDADADPLNEIQTISLDTSDNSIRLSKNGGTFLLPASGANLWKKIGNDLVYQHTTNTGMTFNSQKFELQFGPTVKKSFNSSPTRWSEEFTTFPHPLKTFAFGGEVIEYPVTLTRFFTRISTDTFWRTSSYNYTFQPGTSPGIITQEEIFSQANNNGQPVRVLSTQASGSGGIGNFHASLGGTVRATTGNLNINNVLTPFVGIWTANGQNIYGLFFNAQNQAQLIAQVKNFVEDHPTDPSKQIWYACMEGPEVAAYDRGTGTLQNGVAEILFSEHFGLIVNPQTITIQLTALSADSEGMAVIEKTQRGFKVKELRKGTGNYQFDWEVKAIRKGYENFEVVRDRQSPIIPSKEVYNMNESLPTLGGSKK
ncbi:MAG: hypothetical protein M3Q56_06215 [Bacteroidota bacterium]|nr:hypothetical protein [Bacteroidota bacterium]